MLRRLLFSLLLLPLPASLQGCAGLPRDTRPFLVVLGTGQDAGIPQAGAFAHPGWKDASQQRLVTCLGIVDPATGQEWMIEATPDFRVQYYRLHGAGGAGPEMDLAGIFLTHAHIGHYTGLMFLGHESMSAPGIPVHVMPRMQAFLEHNGPWSQLVHYGNITLQSLADGEAVVLTGGVRVTPFLVPHRQEYSEVVGFRIDGPETSVLFLPDIDSWEEWESEGILIEDLIAGVDVAYLDGTFFDNGEIPGRDMSGFPHPFIARSMHRFSELPLSEREKIRFIHLNHTNPAQFPGSSARAMIRQHGMGVAEEMERLPL